MQVKTTVHKCSVINVHNHIEYKGRFNTRVVGFYLQYYIDDVTYDVSLIKIVFDQTHMKNQHVRERLASEMFETIENGDGEPAITEAQQELERAARIILKVSKSYE